MKPLVQQTAISILGDAVSKHHGQAETIYDAADFIDSLLDELADALDFDSCKLHAAMIAFFSDGPNAKWERALKDLISEKSERAK